MVAHVQHVMAHHIRPEELTPVLLVIHNARPAVRPQAFVPPAMQAMALSMPRANNAPMVLSQPDQQLVLPAQPPV